MGSVADENTPLSNQPGAPRSDNFPKLEQEWAEAQRQADKEKRQQALERALRSSPTDRLTLAERRRALASGLGLAQTEINRLGLPATVARLDDALFETERAIGALTFQLPPEFVEQLIEVIMKKLETRLSAAAESAPSDLMTVAEAAAYIRAKPQRIYDLIGSRRLPRMKDGSRVLIKRGDLEAWISGKGAH
jgi:excisionase family DNA binding protein